MSEKKKILLGSWQAISINLLSINEWQKKQHRVNIAEQLHTDIADDTDLLKNFISGEETWVRSQYESSNVSIHIFWRAKFEKKHLQSSQMWKTFPQFSLNIMK